MAKINNMRSVAILMATYNGGKYLRAQIESLQKQTFTDWTLYVQDDGSIDGTLDVIADIASDDPRIELVDIGLSRQGSGMNFMSLLNMVESQYYMFCDQDDVWFPDKIEKSMIRMKEEEASHPDKPVIVHTDRCHTDAKLNIKLKSEFNPRNRPQRDVEKKIESLKNPNILKIYTIVGGCTMLMNRIVKDVVFPYIGLRVHDSICAMAVADKGGVISTITTPTMFYRLHGGNTCGVSSKAIVPKLLNIFNTLSGNLRGYHIWKVYGGGNFIKFLYWRIKYFMILRTK